jgi:hypothetical protein
LLSIPKARSSLKLSISGLKPDVTFPCLVPDHLRPIAPRLRYLFAIGQVGAAPPGAASHGCDTQSFLTVS